MFVMKNNPAFDVVAQGNMPGEDGEAFSFKATFLALGTTEQKSFDLTTEEDTIAFLRRTLVGIDDILDADEQPVPFNDDTRDWLIDQIHTRGALVKAYYAGVYRAQLGN